MRARAAVLALAVLAAPARADDEVETYVVQPGDTCLGIAVRVLGDRRAYRELHRLNPQLGPLPHQLVPGTVLRVPGHGHQPDAHLTAARGEVRVRRPSDAAWGGAARGMALFRAWRVNAGDRASAELTFLDTSRLRLREQTLVILYGPSRARAKVVASEAVLERGTLEARLEALDRGEVVVRTEDAEASLARGRALVKVSPGRGSAVSNHDGRAASVRGRVGRRPVVVAPGMGTVVSPGRAPSPPRPLPATPVVDADRLALAVTGATAPVTVTWASVDRASHYRVAVEDPAGEVVLAREVRGATQVTLSLAVGRHAVQVAAIDADGLESRPSPPVDVEVVAPTVVPAGARAAVAIEATQGRVAAGTTLLAPPGLTCTSGDAPPGDRVVLRAPGRAEIVCTAADARRARPVVLDVQPVFLADARQVGPVAVSVRRTTVLGLALTAAAPVGDELDVRVSPGFRVDQVRRDGGRLVVTIAVVDPGARAGELRIGAAGVIVATRRLVVEAPPALPAPHRLAPDSARYALGAFVGTQALAAVGPTFPGGSADLRARDPRAFAGVRFTAGDGRVRGELELGLGSLPARRDLATGALVSVRGQALARLAGAPDRLALVLAGGLHTWTASTAGEPRGAVPFAAWGLNTSVGGVRLDLRHLVQRVDDRLAHGVEATLGVSFSLGRR